MRLLVYTHTTFSTGMALEQFLAMLSESQGGMSALALTEHG